MATITPELTVAEAAREAGVTAHTLRYYERDGLMLRAVERSSSGHRRYTAQDLEWVQMLTRLRATGMPIREVRAYTALCREGDGNEKERLALLEAHRHRVLAQLAEVTDHLGANDRKNANYVDRVEAKDRS
jgi:DNA-binding transcriptional MerR regulator